MPASTPRAAEMLSRISIKFGNDVTVLRRSKGLDGKTLAARAYIGRGKVSEIERGIRGPKGWSLGQLCCLADALDCELDVILRPRP